MNETDTKAYIKAQVDKQLSARFWRIAAIIGAIDLVALGGIYWTVLSTARSTAIGVAKEAAEASPLHTDINNRLHGQSAKTAELERTVGLVQGELGTKLENAKKQIQPFVDAVTASSKSDPKRVAEVVREVNKLTEPAGGVLDRLNNLESVAACDIWLCIKAREGSPNYKPTPISYLGSDKTVKAVTREGPGRYRVDLKTEVKPERDLVIATAVRGYFTRVGAEGDHINIIVSNRENKEEDDNVYLMVMRKGS